MGSESESDHEFTEYRRLPFEPIMTSPSSRSGWSPILDAILEDGGILIIGRQVRTDLGGFIDLLGVDRGGNVVVVELKRDRTPRDAVAQPLNTPPSPSGSRPTPSKACPSVCTSATSRSASSTATGALRAR